MAFVFGDTEKEKLYPRKLILAYLDSKIMINWRNKLIIYQHSYNIRRL